MKHLVPLLTAQIRRDITTTVNVSVPAHELEILTQIHGDNVFGVTKTDDCTALEAGEDYGRLCRKYGDDAVDAAYGSPAKAKVEIRKLIEAASTGTQEDDMSGIRLEGPDSLSEAELKAAATAAAAKPKRATAAA